MLADKLKLPDSIKIKFARLNDEEKEIVKLLKKGNNLARFYSSCESVDWNEYDIVLRKTASLICGYNGRFKKYLENGLENLKDTGNSILGYN